MKCSICGNKIEETFLNKIVGTIVVVKKNKYSICPQCQKKFKNREEIVENIK